LFSINPFFTDTSVFGQPGINRVAIGVGMIPQGEVGLVFADIGAASGVLNKPLQAAIIVMVILTTFIAPPLLRLAFKESAEPEKGLKQLDVAK
jgi:Kef-type K+ transport system membrane component KefB